MSRKISPEGKEIIKKKALDPAFFEPLIDRLFIESDLNKDGRVDKNELELLLKGIHENLNIPPPSEEDVDKELKRLDINKDHTIDRDGFKTLVKDLILFCIEQI